jgi:AcrR family transcriptional regulator
MVSTNANRAEPVVGGRGRILRAAHDLFTADGYAAVSMQQIADAAAVNKATLYHHFQDKGDLFVAVIAEEFARTASGVEIAITEGASLRDQFARVAAHVFASSQSDFGRLMSDMRQHLSERRRSELMTRCSPPWDLIRGAVERAIRNGEIRDVDPDLVTRLFFAMVHSQIWWTRSDDARPPLNERLATDIADLLLDGIAMQRGAVAPRAADAAVSDATAEAPLDAGNLLPSS